MPYIIHVDYTTSDSFHPPSPAHTEIGEWESLEFAKNALARIKEHWEWYNIRDNEWRYSKKQLAKIVEPEWHKGLDQYTIVFEMENGNKLQIFAPWCGYFERLKGARVTTKADDDLSFEV